VRVDQIAVASEQPRTFRRYDYLSCIDRNSNKNFVQLKSDGANRIRSGSFRNAFI
jgi:hypothetical protein